MILGKHKAYIKTEIQFNDKCNNFYERYNFNIISRLAYGILDVVTKYDYSMYHSDYIKNVKFKELFDSVRVVIIMTLEKNHHRDEKYYVISKETGNVIFSMKNERGHKTEIFDKKEFKTFFTKLYMMTCEIELKYTMRHIKKHMTMTGINE